MYWSSDWSDAAMKWYCETITAGVSRYTYSTRPRRLYLPSGGAAAAAARASATRARSAHARHVTAG